MSVSRFKNFCKPNALTVNIILLEFIVSKILGMISAYSEYIHLETMRPIIGELLKQSSKDNTCVSSYIENPIHLHVQKFGLQSAQPASFLNMS